MARIVAKRYFGVMPVYNMEVEDLHNYVTPYGSVLHNCRYFLVSHVQAAAMQQAMDEEDEDEGQDYESYLCGGEPTAGYMAG